MYMLEEFRTQHALARVLSGGELLFGGNCIPAFISPLDRSQQQTFQLRQRTMLK